MSISIVVPTFRTPAEVAPLVEEIQRTSGYVDHANIIVTGLQASASVNRNAGLDAATSHIIVMTDDDCTGFPMGWASKLVDVMNQRPQCQMVSARLMAPNGQFGPMLGWAGNHNSGVHVTPERKLVTACCAVRRSAHRFDEALIGSGFDDDCFSALLRMAYPDCEFCVHCGIQVCHLNRMTNQHGKFWDHNRRVYESLWCRK